MTTKLWLCAAVLLCACGADRIVYTDEGPGGNLTAAIDPDAEDDPDAEPDPDAPGLQCPALPEGGTLMPGLKAGWAAADGGATLLQLSNHPFSCGAPVDDVFDRASACPELWAFEISIDHALLAPGTELELTPEQTATLVQFQRGATGSGCARDTVHSSNHGFGGTLKIHAINDECIVGEFVDLTFPTEDLTGLSGVFAAERC